MKILSIDTSCDETAAAVTQDTQILSNIVWSQASAHAKFGGVMPSLAQRMHEERIDWVIDKAINNSQSTINNLELPALGLVVSGGNTILIKINKRLLNN